MRSPVHGPRGCRALGQTGGMHRHIAALIVAALASALAGACTGDSPDDSVARADGDTASGRPFAVVEHTETFVDSSRPTQEPTASPDRTLVTTIRVPDREDPAPLVVLAHGFNGHPRKFEKLTTAWAQAGYVVAAPRFPLTSDDVAEAVLGDVEEQPADVSFVIDEMLRLNDEDGSVVDGRIDPDHVGVAGLSLGGITTLGVTYHSCCRDDRIDAAIAMASVQYPFTGAYELAGVPLLLFHGDADPVVAHESSVDTFAVAAPPKFFVTIVGGGHFEPFEDIEDPADELVQTVSTDFWDLYLAEQPSALDRLLADADAPGLTAVQYETG